MKRWHTNNNCLQNELLTKVKPTWQTSSSRTHIKHRRRQQKGFVLLFIPNRYAPFSWQWPNCQNRSLLKQREFVSPEFLSFSLPNSSRIQSDSPGRFDVSYHFLTADELGVSRQGSGLPMSRWNWMQANSHELQEQVLQELQELGLPDVRILSNEDNWSASVMIGVMMLGERWCWDMIAMMIN